MPVPDYLTVYIPFECLFRMPPEEIYKRVRAGETQLLTSPEHFVQLPHDVCSNCLKPGAHPQKGEPSLLGALFANVIVWVFKAQIPECEECATSRQRGGNAPPRSEHATFGEPVRIFEAGINVYGFSFANHEYAARFMDLNGIDPAEGVKNRGSTLEAGYIPASLFSALRGIRKAISKNGPERTVRPV